MRGTPAIARISAAIFLFVLIAGAAYAENAVGPDFLLIRPHARTAAIGNAFTGLADDANAVIFNPAGIPSITGTAVSFTHFMSFADTNYEYIMFASTRGNWGYGGSVMLDYTLDFPDVNESGVETGQVNNYDFMLSAAAGIKILPGFSAGAGVKYFKSGLLNYVKEGFAADFGVLFRVMECPDIFFGITLLNLGWQNAFETEADSLPLEFKTGIGLKHKITDEISITAAADIGKIMVVEKKINPDIGAGVEVCLYDLFTVSGGFGLKRDGDGFSLGAGFMPVKSVKIYYAFQPFEYLGFTHRISLDLFL